MSQFIGRRRVIAEEQMIARQAEPSTISTRTPKAGSRLAHRRGG
jgi:hypothetical protein